MRTQLTRLTLARALLMPVMIAILGPTGAAWAASGQKQVLVLYSLRRDAQIAVVGERELPRILGNGLPEGLDYYSEFIDQARLSHTDYPAAFRDFLRLKYAEQQFDLVIAMGGFPIEFVEKNRAFLFPDASIVFFSDRQLPSRPANSTGLVAELNLSSTLTLATELQPDTRQVFVVSGLENKAIESAARAQLQRFQPRLGIAYLSGLPTKELETRLAALPEHSIVYFLVVDSDDSGQHFLPLEYLERITSIANRPVYCWVDSAMDHGIIGGSLKNQVTQTRAVADLALRVLHGERADSIPVSASDLNEAQVDSRQLRRWGISEARVPAGTLIRFREPTAWDRYRIYILGAAALLLAQSALIAGLLLQRARRRQAEEQVRRSQAQLRGSYDRIRDLGGRLLSAQEAERARIARELHDDFGQQVALLAINLEQLNGLGGQRHVDPDRLASEALDRVNIIARSMRDLSHRLHPSKLRLIGLVPALGSLQRELSQSDIAITFSHEAVPTRLPHDLTLCLFRIVQEALQNAIKHSGAHRVSVHLSGAGDELALTIVDDGSGFDVDAEWGKGLGLISMAERLEPIGGTLDIRSRPGAGTRLEVAVPFPDEDRGEAAM